MQPQNPRRSMELLTQCFGQGWRQSGWLWAGKGVWKLAAQKDANLSLTGSIFNHRGCGVGVFPPGV